MMEGEPGTPGVVRHPDEETAFMRRKVEAPKRRQRLQQRRAQRKRVAVLTVSAVTLLVFGAVGVFLPSGGSDEVKTAASQAMASDPAGATSDTMVVPSFDAYDEDGDGKVTLGEYLDRVANNRDAALQRVDESSFNETEKTQISDLIKEDYGNHSDCVTRAAQQHDEVMTEQNFDDVYKQLTTEFCPMNDDRIPDAYQAKEMATGQEDAATESSEAEASAAQESAAASSSSQSSSEAEWNPENPAAPPRPVTANDDMKTESASQSSEERPWRPSFPTDPPIPSTKPSGWNPSEPTDPPVPSNTTSSGNEPERKSSVPTNPPGAVSSRNDSSKSEGSLSGSVSKGIGSVDWSPDFPADPPKAHNNSESEPDALPGDTYTTNTLSQEGVVAEQPPYTASGQQPTGAYNTGAEPTAYGQTTGMLPNAGPVGQTTSTTAVSTPVEWMPPGGD